MSIREVVGILENYAPLSFQESYDNAGLIVGNPNDAVTGVLLCIDSTEAIVEEAIQKKCNLIIAHHPIIFSGIKKLNNQHYVERTVIKAIKNDIAIYAAHTNMDNVINGVNAVIADKIGLKDFRILSPKKNLLKKVVTYCPKSHEELVRKAMFNAGAGEIGNYSHCSFNTLGTGTFKAGDNTNPHIGSINEVHREEEVKIETIVTNNVLSSLLTKMIAAHPYEEVAYDIYNLDNNTSTIGSGLIGELAQETDASKFLNDLKVKLNTSVVRHTPIVKKKIKTIAICGGSGSFLLQQAIQQNADVFISADFKYHEFFEADDKIVIADVGHYESEQFTKELFYTILSKKISNFAVHLSEINTNPINYL